MKVELDKVLKTDAPLAELAVIVAKLAENDVAELALFAVVVNTLAENCV